MPCTKPGMKSMTRALVDTNILVYAALKEQKLHSKAVDRIAEIASRGEMAVSTQNLAEVSRVLLEKVKPAISPADVKRIVFGYSRSSIVLEYSRSTVVNAISTKDKYGIHFFDALLVATMQENGISIIVTENTKDFEKIKWLKVQNPFEKRNLKDIKKY